MIDIVIDASVSLAWCFPDEANEDANRILIALKGQRILVPTIWGLEITNALATGQRAKRISSSEILRFISLLEELTIKEDSLSVASSIANVLPLTQKYNLSAYDASYLAVALRNNASLATFDLKLQNAARKSKVKLLRV